MTKSELFKFAHSIAAFKNVAYFGSYQKAFGHVLRDLHTHGYRVGANCRGFQIVEPKRLWA